MSFPGFFFQAEDGIRDLTVTGVQTCALPISLRLTERLERDTARLPPVARHQVLGAVDDDVGLCAKCDPRPTGRYISIRDPVVCGCRAPRTRLAHLLERDLSSWLRVGWHAVQRRHTTSIAFRDD